MFSTGNRKHQGRISMRVLLYFSSRYEYHRQRSLWNMYKNAFLDLHLHLQIFWNSKSSIFVPLFLCSFPKRFLCCFSLKLPSLICLFYLTKWCISLISILFIISCSFYNSLSLVIKAIYHWWFKTGGGASGGGGYSFSFNLPQIKF